MTVKVVDSVKSLKSMLNSVPLTDATAVGVLISNSLLLPFDTLFHVWPSDIYI